MVGAGPRPWSCAGQLMGSTADPDVTSSSWKREKRYPLEYLTSYLPALYSDDGSVPYRLFYQAAFPCPRHVQFTRIVLFTSSLSKELSSIMQVVETKISVTEW